ncbi:MAG: hypothetical protein ACYTEL_09960 [Planctomycetota bacterium]
MKSLRLELAAHLGYNHCGNTFGEIWFIHRKFSVFSSQQVIPEVRYPNEGSVSRAAGGITLYCCFGSGRPVQVLFQ